MGKGLEGTTRTDLREDLQLRGQVSDADRAALLSIETPYPRVNAAVDAVANISEAELVSIGWARTPLEVRRLQAAITSANYVAYGADATQADLERVTELTALAVRARNRAQLIGNTYEHCYNQKTGWTRGQILKVAWARRRFRKDREATRNIANAETKHNQASSQCNPQAKLKWACRLINKPVPVTDETNARLVPKFCDWRWLKGSPKVPLADGTDHETTPEGSENGDSESPEEIRRLEVEALRQTERIRRFEEQELAEYRQRQRQVEYRERLAQSLVDTGTESLPLCGTDDSARELVEFRRKLAQTDRGPEVIRRLEEGAARRPLAPPGSGRPASRVGENARQNPRGSDDHFHQIIWPLFCVVLLITGLGLTVIIYDTFWSEEFGKDVYGPSERNQTQIPEDYERQPRISDDDGPRALNETEKY